MRDGGDSTKLKNFIKKSNEDFEIVKNFQISLFRYPDESYFKDKST